MEASCYCYWTCISIQTSPYMVATILSFFLNNKIRFGDESSDSLPEKLCKWMRIEGIWAQRLTKYALAFLVTGRETAGFYSTLCTGFLVHGTIWILPDSKVCVSSAWYAHLSHRGLQRLSRAGAHAALGQGRPALLSHARGSRAARKQCIWFVFRWYWLRTNLNEWK